MGKKELVWRYSWRGGYSGIDGMGRGRRSLFGVILGDEGIGGLVGWRGEEGAILEEF